MLRINPDKARSILLSPENFNAENEHLQEIIESLNQAGQKVPHNLLLTLLTTLKPLADDYPHDRIYGAALIAYAHHPDAAAERTLRNEMSSAKDRIPEAAAEARNDSGWRRPGSSIPFSTPRNFADSTT
ncbi:MAG UNVERIFIED_CONTAM: hypothetical protein LVR18_10855 [Planctomycetaceae bacterium]|jgi:hypothetical protein